MKPSVNSRCLRLRGSHQFVSHYRALQFCLELCVPPRSLVLDAGCGSRPWNPTSPNSDCIGLDVSRENVKKAHKQSKNLDLRNIACVVGDILKMPFAESAFDVVLSRDVLEHVDNPEDALRDLVFCLKANGTLLVTTSNSMNLTMFIDRLLPPSVSDKITRQLGLFYYKRHRRLNPWSLARNVRKNKLEPRLLMCSVPPFSRHKWLRARSLETPRIICQIWFLFDRISNMSFLRYLKEVMLIIAEKRIPEKIQQSNGKTHHAGDRIDNTLNVAFRLLFWKY